MAFTKRRSSASSEETTEIPQTENTGNEAAAEAVKPARKRVVRKKNAAENAEKTETPAETESSQESAPGVQTASAEDVSTQTKQADSAVTGGSETSAQQTETSSGSTENTSGSETRRWNNNGKVIPPGDFVQICENSGFIKRLDFFLII